VFGVDHTNFVQCCGSHVQRLGTGLDKIVYRSHVTRDGLPQRIDKGVEEAIHLVVNCSLDGRRVDDYTINLEEGEQ
jgi:hypothetical protein